MLHPLLATVLTACLAAALLPAQATPYPVGRRDVAWSNSTGSGSSTLTARIHYPATSAGTNAPVLARSGGWPTVVFLHGFAALGNFYGALGDDLAAAGYVAVMSNTAQFDNAGQERDGRALHAAVVAAGGRAGDPFEGALDTNRIGLAGHSMGGGNTANVLSDNPGYRCGFAFAPVDARGSNAATVGVPFGIVVGTGDSTTPWQSFAQPLYQGLTAYTGIKHLYLLNGDCNHTNVAGLFLSGGTANAVFDRCRTTALGFFARYLSDDASGLEDVIGASARSEPRLVSLSVEVEAPEIWPAAALRIGAVTRISIAAEPGPCGMLAASAAGSTPTPFGQLQLDANTVMVAFSGTASAEGRLDLDLPVPADPTLIGVRLPVQAFGTARDAAFRLGAATALVVGG